MLRWISLLALVACKTDPEPVDDTDPPLPDVGPGAPSAVEIAIEPADPATGEALTVTLLTEAVEPDGDAVLYRYAWTSEANPTTFTEATLPAGTTAYNEMWQVTVTPTDGVNDGPPTVAEVKVGNEAPPAPTLSVDQTIPGEPIELLFDPVVDPDGDVVTTQIAWFIDGARVRPLDNLTVMPADQVGYGIVIRVEVTVADEWNAPVVADLSFAPAFDCDHLPPFNLGDSNLRDARAYHGLAFDDDGTLIGWDASQALVKSLYRQSFSLFVPGIYSAQQIDRLPDGDFVVADDGNNRLLRLTSAGGTSTMATSVGYVYGVTTGPDGKVWSADQGVRRTDPDTGVTEQIVPGSWGGLAHSLNFNLDSTALFIGTIGGGTVYKLDLDAELYAIGRPQAWVTGLGGWHDGIEVDNCGNLYIADYSTSGFYRITPDKEVTLIVRAGSQVYGHGTAWGEGIGGWRTDSIYQPQPYNGNKVREVVIGLASGDTVRTWNGTQVPW